MNKKYIVLSLLSLCSMVLVFFLNDLLWIFNTELYEANLITKDNEKYTVRVNTFRRNHDLKASVEHYINCPSLQEIQIIWPDTENEHPPLSFFDLQENQKSKLKFEVHSSRSLNTRFSPILPIETEAVLSVDDDVIISCDTIEFAFNVWQSSRYSLVGFSPRAIDYNSILKTFRYLSNDNYVKSNGLYNIILTKDCFLHRKYLDSYPKMSSKILDFITEHRNCEDLAMTFLVAKYTNAPPVWVHGRTVDSGLRGGISSGKNHVNIRSECLNLLSEEFQAFLLVPGRGKFVQAKHHWFW